MTDKYVEKPISVIGYINHLGVIEAKAIYAGDFSSHTLDLSKGHRWRWNIYDQCYAAPRGRTELTDEEEFLVHEWLIVNGYSCRPLRGKQEL